MVILNDVEHSFWGVCLEKDKKYSQSTERAFHISMASVDPSTIKDNELVSVMFEHEKKEYILCSLSLKYPQQTLDLNFSEGEDVVFFLKGCSSSVHLTGYHHQEDNLPPYGDEDEDSDDSDEMEEEEEEDESEEEEEEGQGEKKRKLKAVLSNKNKKAKIEGLKADEDDDDDDENEDEDGDDEEYLDDSDEEENGEDDEDEEEGEEEKNKSLMKNKKENQQNKSINKEENGIEEGKKKKKKNKKKNKKNEDADKKENKNEETNKNKVGKGKKKTAEGGVVIEELKEGHGPEAKIGKHIKVYYTGKLQSGKIFDSTTSGTPFSFKLGKKEVISGWDVGLSGMKVGGKRRLTIPPKMGYGSQSMQGIPANSTLFFDVELKAVK